MATLAQKIQCEKDAREMLHQGGLPDPDRVEYGRTCIRLFWEESKIVLVVDIDQPPNGNEGVGEWAADLGAVNGYADDLELDAAIEELRPFEADDEGEEAA